MPKFLITCDATASIEERWIIEADDADQARQLFDDDNRTVGMVCHSERVTGDEENREITEIEPYVDDPQPIAAMSARYAPVVVDYMLETLKALRNECSGTPRPSTLLALLANADIVIAAAEMDDA
jgi:hypothetical protein